MKKGQGQGQKYDASAKAIEALVNRIIELRLEMIKANEFFVEKMGEFSVNLELAMGVLKKTKDPVTGEPLQTMTISNNLYKRPVVALCNIHGHDIVTLIAGGGSTTYCRKCGLTRDEIRSSPS